MTNGGYHPTETKSPAGAKTSGTTGKDSKAEAKSGQPKK